MGNSNKKWIEVVYLQLNRTKKIRKMERIATNSLNFSVLKTLLQRTEVLIHVISYNWFGKCYIYQTEVTKYVFKMCFYAKFSEKLPRPSLWNERLAYWSAQKCIFHALNSNKKWTEVVYLQLNGTTNSGKWNV